ncbi:MAG: hypothetical protein JNK87_10205 [Bryobacterales bacterium]|nr:hypothetical protein [Bryobacterales bacterium]
MAGLLFAVGSRESWATNVCRRRVPGMLHYPWLRAREHHTLWFHAALVLHRDVEPVLWEQTECGLFVAVYGEYYPHHQRIACRQAAAREIAQIYRQSDWNRLKNNNGLYNLVLWDETARTLVVASDMTGALLLFQQRIEGEGVIWSSEAAPATMADLDDSGILQLLSIGYQPGLETACRDVRVFPPATVAVHRPAQPVETSTGLEAHASPAALRQQFPDLLEAAVNLRLSGRPAQLPLTGGLDSRAIGAFLSQAGVNAEAFTIEAGQPRDAAIAPRLAAVLGFPHSVIPSDPQRLRTHRRMLQAALGLTADWHPAHYLPVCGAGREGTDLWLGYLGGTVTGATVHREGESAGLAALTANALDPFLGRTLAALPWDAGIPPGAPQAPRELLVNLYARQRRYTSYLPRLAWNFGAPVCPFADSRLLHAALAAGRADLSSGDALRRLLLRDFPELAEIPNANDGLPLHASSRRWKRNLLRRLGLGKLARRFWPSLRRGYDYSRLHGIAAEMTELVRLEAAMEMPSDLSPMARLALGPILLLAGDDARHSIPQLVYPNTSL